MTEDEPVQKTLKAEIQRKRLLWQSGGSSKGKCPLRTFTRQSDDQSKRVRSTNRQIGRFDSSKTKSPPALNDEQNEGNYRATCHRLQFSNSPLANLRRSASCLDDGPAISMVTEKTVQRSNEDISEACSLPSEQTFIVDPEHEQSEPSEDLKGEIKALKHQLEEFRTLSARQESERLRQADDIRRLVEEVRRLKDWKASILHRLDLAHPAAGDCRKQAIGGAHEPIFSSKVACNVRNCDVSPSFPAPVGFNTCSPSSKANASVVIDIDRDNGEDEEGEGTTTSDENDLEAVDDSPLPDASFSDMNGTLLTANISTDSLDTHRSRISTPMRYTNSSACSAQEEDCQLASESTLLPNDVARSG